MDVWMDGKSKRKKGAIVEKTRKAKAPKTRTGKHIPFVNPWQSLTQPKKESKEK